MDPKQTKGLVEQLARKYVAAAMTPTLHRACADSPRCVRAGPTDLDESDYQRLDWDIPEALKADEDAYTELQNEFVDAFRVEWLAKVKPCK